MQRPLILGASVSNDYLAVSPGKRLALRYTPLEQIKVIARRGTPGREIIKKVASSTFADRSSVICVDTFFWDALGVNPDASLTALNTLARFANDQDIPLVLAEIPEVIPSVQRSARALNRQISKIGSENSNCRVLPLNAIVGEALNKGYVSLNGRKLMIEQILPDGLHISDIGSEFLADEIASLFD